MSEDLPDLEPIDLEAWPAGWYADPWTAGQYRFWNGEAWTGETHRSGPAGAYGATAQFASAPVMSAPMREWSPVPPARGGRGPRVMAIVAGLVVIVLLAGAVCYAVEAHSESKGSKATTAPTIPNTVPSGSEPPSASARAALSGLVVQQADVAPTSVVVLIPDGNRTTKPTLDLCNGKFATEKLRVARLQVEELDSTGRGRFGTEAVVYRNAAATKAAFAELRRVSAACPHAPVKSPVGEETAETRFGAPPDGAWPQTPTVERLAYRFTTTQAGTKSVSVAVYLRRGRVLLGLYFPSPTDPQPAVAGQTSIEGIVGVFAARMAHLPSSVANGSAGG